MRIIDRRAAELETADERRAQSLYDDLLDQGYGHDECTRRVVELYPNLDPALIRFFRGEELVAYDDARRQADAAVMQQRGIDRRVHKRENASQLHDALAVFVLDERIRPLVEAIDPKAMEQARAALLLI